MKKEQKKKDHYFIYRNPFRIDLMRRMTICDFKHQIHYFSESQMKVGVLQNWIQKRDKTSDW